MEFVSRNIRLEDLKPYQIDPSLVGRDEYRPKYVYVKDMDVDTLPPNYFDEVGAVAFTWLNGRVCMPERHRVPCENGIYSWLFVLHHETGHNRLHQAGLEQNELWLNNAAAAAVGPRYGTVRFPFPSYSSY